MSTVDLHKACLEGQAGLVRTAIERGTDVNALDLDKRTPLHWAASNGKVENVRSLLDAGAQLEVRDESSWTPLMIASSAGNIDAVNELLYRGADAKTTNLRGQTPLHYAASKGHVAVGRALMETGADVNARDQAQQVALHRAASSGQDAFVRLLINPPPLKSEEPRPKTRVNPTDRLGNTPLHLSLESGHGSTAVILIEEGGVDRERTNADGQVAEELEGVGGLGQRKVLDYVWSRVGKRE